MKYATLPELLPRAKCVAECRRLSMPAARIADRAGWLQVAHRISSAQFSYAMTDACNFRCAASRMGDLQIARRRTGDRRSLSSSRAGLPASRMFRVSLQLLRQIRRNVSDDQSIILLISQFENVTDPMDLCEQCTFICRNTKPRTQSP
jgi:hypothetical protein